MSRTNAGKLVLAAKSSGTAIGAFNVILLEHAEALVAGTLANPETVETGVDAVRIAVSFEMWTGLVACADSMTVSRDVRLAALQALITAGRPEANDLATRRGSFIGLPKALIPRAAAAAPAVVGVDK